MIVPALISADAAIVGPKPAPAVQTRTDSPGARPYLGTGETFGHRVQVRDASGTEHRPRGQVLLHQAGYSTVAAEPVALLKRAVRPLLPSPGSRRARLGTRHVISDAI